MSAFHSVASVFPHLFVICLMSVCQQLVMMRTMSAYSSNAALFLHIKMNVFMSAFRGDESEWCICMSAVEGS